MSYSNIRDSDLLGPIVGRRVIEVTQHDEEEFQENGESRIYLHFDNGMTVSFPIGDDGFNINDPSRDDMIREATADDKLRLVEMATRFLLESRYGKLFEAQVTPAALGTLIDNVLAIGTILVAEVEQTADLRAGDGPEVDTKIVGMLAIVALPHPLTGGKVADEIAWWVEPEWRQGLLGPKMLRAAEEWATRNRAIMVKMVAPAGTDVGKFYEAIGYEAVETAYIKPI